MSKTGKTYTKYLTVNDDSLDIELFSEEKIHLPFSDLKEITRTKDVFKSFLFIKKDGSTVKVFKTIQNYEKAYLLMKEKFKKYKTYNQEGSQKIRSANN